MAPAAQQITRQDITGLVLAGGRGSRMGGIDKGLAPFNGIPLALHALRRLAPQVGTVMLNANRNVDEYEAFGAPVVRDELADFAGPLAGFLAGLQRCRTPYLLTVPCDTPLFPEDLAVRLAQGLLAADADMTMVSAAEEDRDDRSNVRPQPVFCLMRAALLPGLLQYTQAGGRKVRAWADACKTAFIPFDREGDAPTAFFNANTLAELRALEQAQAAN